MRAAHVGSGSAVGDVDAVDQHAALLGVVEAQEQREDGALAGAGRADDRHRLAGLDRKAQAVQRRPVGPRRIGEGDVAELDRAERRHRQRRGVGRRRDRRLLAEQFGQPLGRAGRLGELAPDLRQRAERAGREDRIKQELAERARRHGARPARRASRTTAPPTTEAKIVKMAKKVSKARARTETAPPRRRSRPLRAKRPVTSFSLVKACSVRTAPICLAGIGGGVAPACPAPARELAAHRAAEGDQRQHDERDRRDARGRTASGWSPPSWRRRPSRG